MWPDMFRKLEEAERLPMGHVGRREARKTIDDTYGTCRNIERFWGRRIGRGLLDPKEARSVADGLCSMLGQAPVKKIVFGSSEVCFGAAAFYRKGDIHVRHGCCGVPLLVHELCHHFGEMGHGESFCEMLVFLFEVTYEMLMGRRPNVDWHDRCMRKAKKGA